MALDDQIRLVIAESQPLFLQGVLRILERVEDFSICASVGTAEEAIDAIHDYVPDLAMVALQLPDAPGSHVLERLGEEIPILCLTSDTSREMAFEAMMLGARGYLLKWYADVRLEEAIRAILRGDIVMDAPSTRAFVRAAKERYGRATGVRTGALLTRREREILSLVARGMSHPAIAEQLGVSKTTVRTHVYNSYAKLQVKGRAAAVSEAMRRGLIGHSHTDEGQPISRPEASQT